MKKGRSEKIRKSVVIPNSLNNKSKFILIPQTALNHGQYYAPSMWPHDLTKKEDIAGGVEGEASAAGGKRVWGQGSQPPTNFYGFRIKNTRFSELSYREWTYRYLLAVSVVTIIVSDITKMFW